MIKTNFGNIELDKLKDYYDTTSKYNNREIEIDLNFEVKSIDQVEFTKIMDFVNDVQLHDQNNRKYIDSNLSENPSVTVDYLSFYVEELEGELNNIIDLSDQFVTNILRWKDKLNLVRVGIYPQADYFATFDYSIDIDNEPCNQLLVVNVKLDGSLHYITWES